MVKGKNKPGQYRAIFGKDPYVSKGRKISRYQLPLESSIQVDKPTSLSGKKLRVTIKKSIIRVERRLLISIILSAVSISISNPAPFLIYEVYKKAKFSYLIFQKIHNSSSLKLFKELSKTAAGKITNQYSDMLATSIKLNIHKTGYFKTISSHTGESEATISRLFDSTIHKGLNKGVDNLSDFVIEGVL